MNEALVQPERGDEQVLQDADDGAVRRGAGRGQRGLQPLRLQLLGAARPGVGLHQRLQARRCLTKSRVTCTRY